MDYPKDMNMNTSNEIFNNQRFLENYMDVESGKFNFGLDTLKRISLILARITMICELPPTKTRQRLHIDAVKSYFSEAGILISLKQDKNSVAALEKYSKEVDNLKPASIIRKGKKEIYYDPKLEMRLFQLRREIGIVLKEYYMPIKEYDEDDY